MGSKLLDEAERLLQVDPALARAKASQALLLGSDRARALAIVGSSYRIRFEIDQAKAAFYLAIKSESLSRQAEATLLGKLASLHRETAEFETALALLRRRLSLANGELEEAKAMIQIAILVADPAFEGSVQFGREKAAEALAIFEKHECVEHARSAAMLKLACSAHLDDSSQLARELEEFLNQHQPPPGSVALGHSKWLEGVVRRRLGQFEGARRCFEQAETTLAALNVPGPWAACLLDKALLELVAGRPTVAAQICGRLFPIFVSLQRRSEAWAALRALIGAAGQGSVTACLIEKARRALARAKIPPHPSGSTTGK